MSFSFPAPRPLAYRNQLLEISSVSLKSLAQQFGTPLYVYSAEDIGARWEMLARAFARSEHTVCYAVKANSSLALLRLLGQKGGGFDVVSGGELERVRRAAPEALRSVVFSGVGKQTWEIDAALQANILLFNVESEAEMALLSQRAKELGKEAPFALRVNPDVAAETHPYISTGLRDHKFGLALENAREVYLRARAMGGLRPMGVSVHIGSQIQTMGPFTDALNRVAVLVNELRAEGMQIRYVDAGGGLGVEYGQGAFNPQERALDYAAALRKATSKLNVHLLLEPGRFLVAQAGVLLTRVLATKRNGVKRFVITDAAMNDLIRPALYRAHHEILPVEQGSESPEVADVVGPVCESGDFFAHDRAIVAECGDLLAVLDAGAYGMSLSSNYNTRPRPAEVLVENGHARLIRRRESIGDLLAAEQL